MFSSYISIIFVDTSAQTNPLKTENDNIYFSPDESSPTVVSIENASRVAPLTDQVQVSNLTTVNETKRPEEFPSSERVDSVPGEEEIFIAEKNRSQDVKPSTKILSISPPTPSLNTSSI